MSSNESLEEIISNFPDNLQISIKNWLLWDKNVNSLEELSRLIRQKDVTSLSKLMLNRQLFGTAGIRGLMEPGFNGLNDLIVIQTSQGLAKYLLQSSSQNKKIIIGHDGRHGSYRFARLATKVFLHSGFEVGLFSAVVPTPFVSFGTKLFKAAAGIVITASHNPKQYNGYKVFNTHGAQILSPHDANIQNLILENLKPWTDDIWNTDNLNYSKENKLFDPLSTVMEQYYLNLRQSSTQLDLVKNSNLKIAYSAMHGVGHNYLTKVFEEFEFKNYYPVRSQMKPDPEFPTLEFPNPEEGEGAFDEAKKTAKEQGCTLIFANDPDSDRFCMAELVEDTNWRVFNGNEIGALLGWWLWQQFSETNLDKVPKSDCYMISSAVSSKILHTYAKKEGFNFIETLTGFKWMGNQAFDLAQKGKKVLLCFEEAIGFMPGCLVYDKDGISTTAVVLQMAAYLRSKNLTFAQLLDNIYQQYGLHFSINSYYLCYDPEKIKRIFNNIPTIKSVNDIKVIRIRDLMHGFDSSTKDNKPELPKACMITYYFENGSVITFRTSGTEPKIKYYSEIAAPVNECDTKSDWDHYKQIHRQLIESVVQLILQPELNGLIPKKD